MAQPFMWNGNTGDTLTPQQIAAQRAVAQSIIAQQSTPKNVGEGFSAIGDALLYNAANGRATSGEDAGLKSANDAYGALGDSPTRAALMQAEGNQFLTPGQRAVTDALLKQQIAASDPSNQLDMDYKRAQIANLGVLPGYRKNADGGMVAIPGGPADPANPLNQSKVQPPSDVQEYNFAKSQGYAGTYMDYLGAKKGNGLSITTNPDGTTSIVQGGPTKALTEGQGKDAVYFTRGAGALPILDKYGDALTNLPASVGGNAPIVGNYVKPEDYQLAEQAGQEFLQAILRKDTGAAITKEETAAYGETYLPRPGNSPALLAQKKAARARALQALKLGIPPQGILAMEQAGTDLNAGKADSRPNGAVTSPGAPIDMGGGVTIRQIGE